jgi:hypothetical protein
VSDYWAQYPTVTFTWLLAGRTPAQLQVLLTVGSPIFVFQRSITATYTCEELARLLAQLRPVRHTFRERLTAAA